MKIEVFGYKPIATIMEIDDAFKILERDEEFEELNNDERFALIDALENTIKEELNCNDFKIKGVYTDERAIYEA